MFKVVNLYQGRTLLPFDLSIVQHNEGNGTIYGDIYNSQKEVIQTYQELTTSLKKIIDDLAHVIKSISK